MKNGTQIHGHDWGIKDTRSLSKLLSTPDWEAPEWVWNEVPESMSLMAMGKKKDAEGNIVDDPTISHRHRVMATKVLAQLMEANVSKRQKDVQISFHPNVMPMLQPDAPETIEAVAYIEHVEEHDLLETAKALMGTSLDPDQMNENRESNIDLTRSSRF